MFYVIVNQIPTYVSVLKITYTYIILIWQEINVQGKSTDEITELCLDQILCQKPSDVPFVPRVTLIGPKGSGRFIVASALSKRFNLVLGKFDGRWE